MNHQEPGQFFTDYVVSNPCLLRPTKRSAVNNRHPIFEQRINLRCDDIVMKVPLDLAAKILEDRNIIVANKRDRSIINSK